MSTRLFEDIHAIRLLPRSQWRPFIGVASAASTRTPYQLEIMATALLMLSPWKSRAERPTVELEGRHYRTRVTLRLDLLSGEASDNA